MLTGFTNLVHTIGRDDVGFPRRMRPVGCLAVAMIGISMLCQPPPQSPGAERGMLEGEINPPRNDRRLRAGRQIPPHPAPPSRNLIFDPFEIPIPVDPGTATRSSAAYHAIRPTPGEAPTPVRAESLSSIADSLIRGERQGAMPALWQAVNVEPENGTLSLLASQVALALGDFGAAAVLLRHGLTLAHPDQWGAPFSGRWGDFQVSEPYVRQLAELRAFLAERPDATYARLLLAYHFAYSGRMRQAVQELESIVAADQRDVAAWELLRVTQTRQEAFQRPLEVLPPPSP